MTFERCLAAMALLAGPSRLSPPGGLAPASEPIAWIADNHVKGISVMPSLFKPCGLNQMYSQVNGTVPNRRSRAFGVPAY